MQAVLTAFKANKIKFEEAGSRLCANERVCAVYAGPVQVNAIGFTVEAMVSSRASPERYQQICAAALSGLAGVSMANARSYIFQGFTDASFSGAARYKVGSVLVQIDAQSDSRLRCQFVKN